MSPRTISGAELQVGDTIGGLWWRPYRDTIISLRPHPNPIVPGQQIAHFAIRLGMSIDPGARFELIHRPADRIVLVPVPVFIPRSTRP